MTINFVHNELYLVSYNHKTLSLCTSWIRNGAQGSLRKWKLKDCIAVHKCLDTALEDHDAALSKSFAPCYVYKALNY